MTYFEKGDWGHTIIIEMVEQNPELEKDIRRWQDALATAEDLYEAMYYRYWKLPGWEVFHDMMSMALGRPEIPMEVLPEKE